MRTMMPGRLLATGMVVALAAGTLGATRAEAQPRTFRATLDGAQENPSVPTPATGFGTLVFDAAAGTLQVSLSFTGLTSPTGGPNPPAHLHVGAPGVNGPVVVPFAFVPLGVTSGTWTNQMIMLTPTQVTSLSTNLVPGVGGVTNMYFNVHTAAFPGGEIRGQVVASVIPEPSTYALLASGLLGVGGLTMRRRRQA